MVVQLLAASRDRAHILHARAPAVFRAMLGDLGILAYSWAMAAGYASVQCINYLPQLLADLSAPAAIAAVTLPFLVVPPSVRILVVAPIMEEAISHHPDSRAGLLGTVAMASVEALTSWNNSGKIWRVILPFALHLFFYSLPYPVAVAAHCMWNAGVLLVN